MRLETASLAGSDARLVRGVELHRRNVWYPTQSGGSVACNSRIVISAVFGDGMPAEVSRYSNSSLAQRVRTRFSDSHTR
jgi:hypothetical protein